MCSRPVPGAAGAGRLLLPVAGGGGGAALSLLTITMNHSITVEHRHLVRAGGQLRGPGEGPQVPLRLVPPLLRDVVWQPGTSTL